MSQFYANKGKHQLFSKLFVKINNFDFCLDGLKVVYRSDKQ